MMPAVPALQDASLMGDMRLETSGWGARHLASARTTERGRAS